MAKKEMSRAEKIAGVVFLVVALPVCYVIFWPYVTFRPPDVTTLGTSSNVSESAQPSQPAAVSQPEPVPAPKPPGKWTLQRSQSEMDGSDTVVVRLQAENEIQGWLKSSNPTLVLRCQEQTTELYVDVGVPASVENIRQTHTVRLRFDEGKPTRQLWGESTDREALFAKRPISVAKRIAKSERMLFEFIPFQAGRAIVEFDVSGGEEHIGEVAQTCGWKLPAN